jgi:hypothetical protein
VVSGADRHNADEEKFDGCYASDVVRELASVRSAGDVVSPTSSTSSI